MKKALFIICILSAGLTITSCKKKNLTNDQWIISQATDLEDGQDITSDFSGEIWEYNKDGTYRENANLKGTWAFSDDKEDLIITKLDNSTDSYKILKLKKKEMWIEELGKEELHLTKY